MNDAGGYARLRKGGRALTALRQALIIAAITVVLCEIGLRVFHAVYPLPFFYSGSYNRFRVKPNAVFYGHPLNSRGFNDVEFKIDKEPGVYRILGIGDSFAFGVVPYRDNYLTLIEERLKADGVRTELINMGIPGISPREYLAVLIHEGLQLKPDMVLLTFFVGNDFTEPTKISTAQSVFLSREPDQVSLRSEDQDGEHRLYAGRAATTTRPASSPLRSSSSMSGP